jgi:hypothetical protein
MSRLGDDWGAMKAPIIGVPVALRLVTWQTNFEGTGRGLAMRDMAQFVSSLNLSRFAGRLRVERDLTTRSSLLRLLIEEANNFNLQFGTAR